MAATAGPNLGLVSGWGPRDDEWDAQMNRNLRDLDAWVQASVKGILNAPPTGASAGDRYIIGVGTGAWADHDGELAAWRVSGWEFLTPKRGMRIHVEPLGRTYLRTATAWVPADGLTLADDFDTLQDAVNATPPGGLLQLGSRVYAAPSGGLLLSYPIEIKGPVGVYGGPTGAWLTPVADATGEPAIRIERSATMVGNVYLHDFNIASAMGFVPSAPKSFHNGAHGILIETHEPDSGHDNNPNPLSNIVLHRISVGAMGHDAVHATALDGSSNSINNLVLEKVQAFYCAGDGAYLANHVGCAIRDCYVHRNSGRGLVVSGGGYSVHNNVVEGNCTEPSLDHYLDGQVVTYAVRPFSFLANHIEAFADGTVVGGVPRQPASRGLVIRGSVFGTNSPPWQPLNGYDGGGFVVEGNIFVMAAEVADNLSCSPSIEPRGIYVDKSCSGHFHIGPNFFRNCNVPIEVAATADYAPPGITVADQHVEVGGTLVAGEGLQLLRQAAGGLRDLSPVANRSELAGHLLYDTTHDAARILKGTGRWALTNNAPRVTTSQRDAGAWEPGDIVWNTTTNALECYTGTGTTWKTVCSMA